MTREEFIRVLDKKRYRYDIAGNKIAVTYWGDVDLASLKTIPSGVVFGNGGYVNLNLLETLSPGVEFRNGGHVVLNSLETLTPSIQFNNGGDIKLGLLFKGWFDRWSGNIEGIDPKKLLNKMISDGVLDRR